MLALRQGVASRKDLLELEKDLTGRLMGAHDPEGEQEGEEAKDMDKENDA